MADSTTSAGQDVPHCHVGPDPDPPCYEKDFTFAERQERRELQIAQFPNAVEVRVPSRKYNCHGYAYTQAHGWFEEPEFFIDDDFSEIPIAEAKRGHVLVYEKGGEIKHSALVKQVSGGTITKVRSKWGKWAALVHHPDEVPAEYGFPMRLLRRNL